MKSFIMASSFKKTTLTYLASKIPEENVDELRKMFIAFDTDGDGKISAKEFKVGMQNHGVVYNQEEVNEIMNSIDLNGNGFLDYTEFLAGCMKSKIYLNEDLIKASFAYFD